MRKKMNFSKVFMSLCMVWCFIVPVSAEGISPRYISCTPQSMVEVDTKTIYTRWDDTSKYVNNTNYTQTGSVSLSRQKSSSFGVTGSVEIKKVIAKVGISAELTTNSSQTVTKTQTATVPPKTTINARFGSELVRGRSRMRYVKDDCSSTYGTWFNYNYSFGGIFEWY